MDATSERSGYAIAVHGGAGPLPRREMTPDRERAYRHGLLAALRAGAGVLAEGGEAIEAVSRAVVALEDDPLFNAGRGAVFSREGRNELDAAIMDGATLAAGAVCGITRIRNPILLARAVMRQSAHVMLAGAGAERFAVEHGFELVPEAYFRTEERWSQLQRILAGGPAPSPLTISHVGTVGAVARDRRGHLAAATSTGGMTAKAYGRIGDSPIIGAGTYADDRTCAVSATGHGEIFIRAAVAHDVAARMRYGGRDLGRAVEEIVHGELIRLGGEGGLIAVDAHGRIEMRFNCEGMFRAAEREGEEPEVAIYA